MINVLFSGSVETNFLDGGSNKKLLIIIILHFHYSTDINNRVLFNRIKAATDPKLRDEQAGFRSNRSTTDQIATLRIIVQQSLEWNSPLIVNSLDYEKAFDSVDRELLWKILRNYGIPEKIVSLVRKMNDGTCCR
ncbi:reverse transcriptase SR3-right [Elysia marginata]|uniref:Reverse transcriptase SR3-right n=1 Tax=Elysia marginata TaxID=1093978 RepID=A0AAV4H2X0_9GAST|nr:reverse transcriptase SR3-right [Elysia marginata]